MTVTSHNDSIAPSSKEPAMNTYETQIDAEIAATNVARANGLGYAFAVEWFDHWSVEPRKPSFRGTKNGRSTKVIECRAEGGRYIG